MPGISADDRPPMVEAMIWISRLTTVTMEIVLPGLLGHWLDDRWGTGFLALVGFGLGLVCGMQHLLKMARTANNSSRAMDNPTWRSGETAENGKETSQ